jgi:hypothetical protein
MNIPTAHSGESLERFIKHIGTVNKPLVVDRPYLRNNGFVSGNDPELRHIGRLLGFLDEEYKPLGLWEDYKNQGNTVLQAAIVNCYTDLFEKIEKPYLASDATLLTWFQPPITGKTRSAMERAVRTFRKLCQLAGYDMSDQDVAVKETPHDSYSHNSVILRSAVVLQLHPHMNEQNYRDLFKVMREELGEK